MSDIAHEIRVHRPIHFPQAAGGPYVILSPQERDELLAEIERLKGLNGDLRAKIGSGYSICKQCNSWVKKAKGKPMTGILLLAWGFSLGIASAFLAALLYPILGEPPLWLIGWPIFTILVLLVTATFGSNALQNFLSD